MHGFIAKIPPYHKKNSRNSPLTPLRVSTLHMYAYNCENLIIQHRIMLATLLLSGL